MQFYGSLNNRLMETSRQPEPTVGMAATKTSYSDRHAGTVVAFDKKSGIVSVQLDHAKRTDNRGMCDSQEYSYERNLDAPIYNFKRRKDGRWCEGYTSSETNRWRFLDGGNGLILGVRDHHFDFSF